MSVAAPPPPPRPRRSRLGLVAGAAVVIAVVAYFAFSGIGDALVYYRTPSEVKALGSEEVGRTLRLGGLVKTGTLDCSDGGVRFTLTDTTSSIDVHNAPGEAVQCPRIDAGAVVEGTLDPDGTFAATQILIKHNEQYVAPTQGAVPSHLIPSGNGG